MPEAKVRYVTVAPERGGQRIDNFLSGMLKGLPRPAVYRLLRTGQVRVNRGRVKPGYRLRPGDEIRIPPVDTRAPAPPRAPAGLLQRLAGAVIHEDSHLLVLDKPASVPVHTGTGVGAGVIEALRSARTGFLELGHRLDRETSGCLALAKDRETLLALHGALRAGTVEKGYLALVRGSWQEPVRVTAPLDRTSTGSRVAGQGKRAVTWFAPGRTWGGASLVSARIGTGRTHQVRVHAAHQGHPVAGDRRYGDPSFNRRMRKLGLERLFLHAAVLQLRLPHGEVIVSAPLPAELKAVLERLEGAPAD